jgi:hypothetical protein
MNQNNFIIPSLFNPGLLAGKLPEPLFSRVKEAVTNPEVKKTRPVTEHLVGTIRHEYSTPEIPGLRDYIHEMYSTWKNIYKTPDVPYTIDPIWTNYMRKGEFNPNHMHPGALAVFVIWVNIPYDLQKELSYNDYNNPNYPPKNSCFEFTYSTYEGKIISSPVFVDKSMEGTITMFPATLTHCVYPFFTSEGERISIAGNIYSSNVA